MTEEISEKKQAENEAFFRQQNEKVEATFKELEEIAAESGQDDWIRSADLPIHFFCECSDENCKERIILPPSKYQKIHKDRKQFVVLKSHENDAIEEVVEAHDKFYVVRKHANPPESPSTLNSTDIDNT